MIYSGSSYKFLISGSGVQIRIRNKSFRTHNTTFKRHSRLWTNTIKNVIPVPTSQQSRLPVYAIFYFILQSYSTYSPEFTGLSLELKLLLICSFIFRDQEHNSGYGSRKSSGSVGIRIHYSIFYSKIISRRYLPHLDRLDELVEGVIGLHCLADGGQVHLLFLCHASASYGSNCATTTHSLPPTPCTTYGHIPVVILRS